MRLVCDIEAGMIETVVVHSIDRISRSFVALGKWIGFLNEYGVDLVSVIDKYQSPVDDALLDLIQSFTLKEYKKHDLLYC